MVIPRFVRWALAGEPIRVYGTGKQSRCFCNVADVVDVLVELIECPGAVGEVINIGTVEQITIDALADLVIELAGSSSEKRYLSYEEAYGRPFDDMQIRVPDLSKIKRLVGFEPKYNLEQTLRQVIDYERSRPGREDRS